VTELSRATDHIAVVDAADRSRFEVLVDGELAGFAEYHRRPGLIAFVHTSTDPRFEGRGLASELVRAALSEARSEGLSVLPFCPFVRGCIARHPDDLELVPTGLRAHFGLVADV
jgi:predicted GNAT family acetyltransferase